MKNTWKLEQKGCGDVKSQFASEIFNQVSKLQCLLGLVSPPTIFQNILVPLLFIFRFHHGWFTIYLALKLSDMVFPGKLSKMVSILKPMCAVKSCNFINGLPGRWVCRIKHTLQVIFWFDVHLIEGSKHKLVHCEANFGFEEL